MSYYGYRQAKMSNNRQDTLSAKSLISVVAAFIFVAGLIATLMLLKQNQDIRNQASTDSTKTDQIAFVSDTCVKAGCNGEICVDEEQAKNIATTCVALPKYQCYKTATCEVQPDGKCGFTQTDELTSCLKQYEDDQPTLTPKPVETPTPTPPPNCYYKQVTCFKAPCDPILVCNTPSPSATPQATQKPIPTPPPPTCTYNGTPYQFGQTFPATDGCNTCTCTYSGQVSCTEMACNVTGDPPTCLVDGTVYQNGDSFTDSDGCNSCTCMEGKVVCTARVCDVSTSCTYNGTTYNDQESFPAGDNCNTCTCNNGTVNCTEIACNITGDPPTCLVDGTVYQNGDSFTDSDGCNTCTCSYGKVLCTKRACEIPSPPPGCHYEQVKCVKAPCDPILVCPTNYTQQCSDSGGTWESFDDSCLDLCDYVDKKVACRVQTADHCNCGPEMCWSSDVQSCIPNQQANDEIVYCETDGSCPIGYECITPPAIECVGRLCPTVVSFPPYCKRIVDCPLVCPAYDPMPGFCSNGVLKQRPDNECGCPQPPECITDVSLKAEPKANITMNADPSGITKYGINAILRFADGSVVTDQSGVDIVWQVGNENIISLESEAICPSDNPNGLIHGIEYPCPEMHAAITGLKAGTTTITAQAYKKAGSVAPLTSLLAETTYTVTVNEDELYCDSDPSQCPEGYKCVQPPADCGTDDQGNPLTCAFRPWCTWQADLNLDKKVDIDDYTILSSEFFQDLGEYQADITGDGKVDIDDYTILSSQFSLL